MSDSRSHSAGNDGHVTVLLVEAVAALNLHGGEVIVDGTFGGGGHSRLILDHEPAVSRLVAIDADPAAKSRAEALRAEVAHPELLALVHDNFRNLEFILWSQSLAQVDGVLLDLGLSSFQLDEGDRGFSFRFDAPLDMRFDTDRGQTAAELLASLDQDGISRVLWDYGDERRGRRIAGAIVREREKHAIETTGQLATLVERVVGGRKRTGIHPATRTFQALRIAVNDELEALQVGLDAAIDALAPGGRLVVIAFHSLEDRIVKRTIERAAITCVCPPEQPVCTCDTIPRLKRVGKAIKPSDTETERNPRSRSAIMRVAERLDDMGEPVQERIQA